MVGELLPDANIEAGLLPPALDDGRCCHIKLPDRARLDALGEGFVADSTLPVCCAGLCVDGVPILDFLDDPKPVNSGTSLGVVVAFVDPTALLSIAVEVEQVGGVNGGGEAMLVALEGDRTVLRGVDTLPFCGLIDLARSAARSISHHQP